MTYYNIITWIVFIHNNIIYYNYSIFRFFFFIFPGIFIFWVDRWCYGRDMTVTMGRGPGPHHTHTHIYLCIYEQPTTKIHNDSRKISCLTARRNAHASGSGVARAKREKKIISYNITYYNKSVCDPSMNAHNARFLPPSRHYSETWVFIFGELVMFYTK